MTIKCIQLDQVICDECGTSIMVNKWRDVLKLGWAVPNDGAFQKCPTCVEAYKNKLFTEAKLVEIASKCPLSSESEDSDGK